MPPDGYKEKASASETDFNGIISVILNHKDFQGKVHENLSNKINIFEEVNNIPILIMKTNVKHFEIKQSLIYLFELRNLTLQYDIYNKLRFYHAFWESFSTLVRIEF
jgi:hypothetical protein